MQRNHSIIPELLAPAGSFEKLVTAIHYGADAVYLAGKRFSLRARAGNFDEQGLEQAVEYAHARGVKVYVTVNIFAHNADLDGLEDYLLLLDRIGVDGLIIADPGILSVSRETLPDMPIHLSTQANVTNAASVRFWAGQGITRLNLARELGLDEIKEIRTATDIELEMFVHGALCISYSGRCMLSNYFTGRDANLGDCAHPCRYSYNLVEEKRPGQYFPVEEDERGTYIFNSQDLCLLNRLPELISAGADSLKIEGRMKAIGYVGGVVRVYRAALDWIKEQIDNGADVAELVLPSSFTMDGEGTVITTETCFLNKNRNPNWTRAEVEAELCRTLGAEKVIWIPGDVTDTETDGHIDGIAAFIEPGRVLVEVNPDTTDPHYEIGKINTAALKNQKDARGRELQLEFIQEGIYHPGIWNGGCSSYVNSYLANGAVIVPGYGYERDAAAIETYRGLYPQREIVQVKIHDIAVGGGGVHCITQQQPTPTA